MAEKENIGTRLLDDLGSMLLNIEIDSDLWVGKDRKAKLRYLKNKLSGENRKKLINVGTHLVESVIDIVKSNASGPMKDYADVAETALNLGKASMIINNLFVSQKYEVHTDYDELAKFMGYKNGQAIHTTQMNHILQKEYLSDLVLRKRASKTNQKPLAPLSILYRSSRGGYSRLASRISCGFVSI